MTPNHNPAKIPSLPPPYSPSVLPSTALASTLILHHHHLHIIFHESLQREGRWGCLQRDENSGTRWQDENWFGRTVVGKCDQQLWQRGIIDNEGVAKWCVHGKWTVRIRNSFKPAHPLTCSTPKTIASKHFPPSASLMPTSSSKHFQTLPKTAHLKRIPMKCSFANLRCLSLCGNHQSRNDITQSWWITQYNGSSAYRVSVSDPSKWIRLWTSSQDLGIVVRKTHPPGAPFNRGTIKRRFTGQPIDTHRRILALNSYPSKHIQISNGWALGSPSLGAMAFALFLPTCVCLNSFPKTSPRRAQPNDNEAET